MHTPKVEIFDVAGAINVDPKGFDRAVDRFHTTDFGLYMARGADHPKFGYLESWLLPSVGLRVNRFHVRNTEGAEGTDGTVDAATSEYQEFYCDVARISRPDANAADATGNADAAQASAWTTRDLYVDLLSTTGNPVTVEDIDELSQAASEGLLDPAEVEYAIETTLAAVEGITRHGDDVMAWLETLDMPLTWAEEVELTPAAR